MFFLDCASKRREGKLSKNMFYKDTEITVIYGLPEEIET